MGGDDVVVELLHQKVRVAPDADFRELDPYNDLARAISFIEENSERLGVAKTNYSLWGGSAGARMAATLGNSVYLRQLTADPETPQP